MQPHSIPHSRHTGMDDAGAPHLPESDRHSVLSNHIHSSGPSFPTSVQPIISSSAFSHAHSFSINNPLLAERISINYTQDSPSDYQALSWLCVHTIRGVEFSSAARDPPPRCHPGTRERLQNKFQEWLDRAKSSTHKVVLLYGPAGVGKSAIVQSVAERTIRDRKLLGATLFFNPLLRGQGTSSTQNEPSKLWLTIAYRLATKHPSYSRHILPAVALDPTLVEQSMEHQFHSLITEPIGVNAVLDSSPGIVPIFLDGLEQFSGPRVQEHIIRLILKFTSTYPDAPLVWIISFRAERYLTRVLYENAGFERLIIHVSVPMHSEEAKKDVQVFMRSKFREMQRQHDIVEPMPWPIEKELTWLLVLASGLFIFASAVISFCGDPGIANPADQFQVVLALTYFDTRLPLEALERHPLFPVHVMYQHILEGLASGTFETVARRILGFMLLPKGYGVWTTESTSLWALCNILNITQPAAYACLSKLTAVLDIPVPNDATHTPIRFLHQSFAHYLLDRGVSKEFWIDVKTIVADLWQCHFRALGEANTFGDNWLPKPSEVKLSWPSKSHDEVEEFCNEFWENGRRLFFHYLSPYPSSSCPPALPHYYEINESQYPTEFIELLTKIRFDMLVDGFTFPDFPYRLITFLDWLFDFVEKHHILGLCLSRRTLFSCAESRIDWPRLGVCFKIYVERFDDGGCTTTFKPYTSKKLDPPRHIDPSRFFSTREPSESIGVLQEELSTREGLASITVPPGKKNCYILMDSSSPRHKVYYILPQR